MQDDLLLLKAIHIAFQIESADDFIAKLTAPPFPMAAIQHFAQMLSTLCIDEKSDVHYTQQLCTQA